MNLIPIAVLPLQDAKDFQRQLSDKGVEISLNHNDQTCTRGCAITVEVHGAEKDLPIIAKTYQENFQKLTEGHEIDWNALNAVFDPSKETAVCPACSFEFSTSKKECPDCGLVLG